MSLRRKVGRKKHTEKEGWQERTHRHEAGKVLEASIIININMNIIISRHAVVSTCMLGAGKYL